MELVLRLVVCLRSSPAENSHEHSHPQPWPPPAEMAALASTSHTRPNLECRRARLIGPPSMKKCFSLVTRGSTECFFVRWWHWRILRAIDPLQPRSKYMCLLGGLYSIDPTRQRGTQVLLWGDMGFVSAGGGCGCSDCCCWPLIARFLHQQTYSRNIRDLSTELMFLVETMFSV